MRCGTYVMLVNGRESKRSEEVLVLASCESTDGSLFRCRYDMMDDGSRDMVFLYLKSSKSASRYHREDGNINLVKCTRKSEAW